MRKFPTEAMEKRIAFWVLNAQNEKKYEQICQKQIVILQIFGTRSAKAFALWELRKFRNAQNLES